MTLNSHCRAAARSRSTAGDKIDETELKERVNNLKFSVSDPNGYQPSQVTLTVNAESVCMAKRNIGHFDSQYTLTHAYSRSAHETLTVLPASCHSTTKVTIHTHPQRPPENGRFCLQTDQVNLDVVGYERATCHWALGETTRKSRPLPLTNDHPTRSRHYWYEQPEYLIFGNGPLRKASNEIRH